MTGIGFGNDDIRRGCRVEPSGAEIAVEPETGPGVDCGIGLLLGRESVGLPVGKSLAFGYALAEDDSVDLLERSVGDVILLDERLQLDKALRLNLARASENREVVVDREPNLGNGGVAQEVDEPVEEPEDVDAEEESEIVGSDLHQGDFMETPFAE